MSERSGLQDDKNRKKSIADKLNAYVFTTRKKISSKRVSIHIAGVYVAAGVLWILLSDKILHLLIEDKSVIEKVSMVKGWCYVAASGVLISFLVYNALQRIVAAENELINKYKELASAYDELGAAYEEVTDYKEKLEKQYELLLHNQQQLRESEERYKLVTEASNDGIWDWNVRTDIKFMSDRWHEIFGYSANEIENMGAWQMLIHPEDADKAYEIMNEHIRRKTPYYVGEYRIRTKDGGYKWIQAKGKALFDEKGQMCRMTGSYTDITELKQYQQKLHHYAYHDTLTGLPNRLSLYEELSKLFHEDKESSGALLYIDLDNFKLINDTMGHAFGDQFIVKIKERLVGLVGGGTSLYKLGGDEFIVFIHNVQKISAIEEYAQSVIQCFKEPVKVVGSLLHSTVSIGVAMYPDHGTSIDALLKSADIALYKAKDTGKNCYVMFNRSMDDEIAERMNIEKHLYTALSNGEFELHYQPQLDITTNTICGLEALLRWKNPVLGNVPPDKFIKIAEDTHLIIPIGKWVLANACSFIKKMHLSGLTDIMVSVNVSILQLLQNDFVDVVLGTLEDQDIHPGFLEIEITESILMESFEAIAGKLRLLRNKGVKIALDDFGKGYSSLTYLKQLPLTTLKIDKSFIDDIMREESDKPITGNIVRIGHIIGLCVVAEGVETKEQFEYLVKHQCDRIQGYLFHKPIPEKEVLRNMHSLEGVC